MKAGFHHLEFLIGDTFFEENVNEDIIGGNIVINLQIEKQENLIALNFDFNGVLFCACDRCLEKIPVRVCKHEKLILKLVAKVEPNDNDIIFLNNKTSSYNIEALIFEYLCMEIPMRKVHGDESSCNQEMLGLIDKYAPKPDSVQIDERWDDLKNISI
jgi:uncharacterized metal-binding protein YceD (DUF177 family)